MIRALLLFPLLFMFAQPCLAIREGTATANIFIHCYEQHGDFGKLALWHEAAAECITRISVPMNEIAHDYYVRHGYKKWAARAQKEAQEIQAQRDFHLTRAKAAWTKLKSVAQGLCASAHSSALKTEREKIAKFIATWLPRYPDRFYECGIYPTFFRKQQRLAEQKGDYATALQLEADAAEMCAAQYQKMPIAYGLKNYEKRRDAYLRHAARLRILATQKEVFHQSSFCSDFSQWYKPPLCGVFTHCKIGFLIIGRSHLRIAISETSDEIFRQSSFCSDFSVVKIGFLIHCPVHLLIKVASEPSDDIYRALLAVSCFLNSPQGKTKRPQGMTKILPVSPKGCKPLQSRGYYHLAQSDARVKAAIAGQSGVHAYAQFQGFAWIVRFSNHSWGNLATAIIDDKTGKVLDVLIPVDGLEKYD